jgi:hypothetical protein
MKSIYLCISLFLITLVTQNFQCGRETDYICNQYNNDTIFVPFQISSNNMQTLHVLDTIFFESTINYTMNSVNGRRFSKNIENANLGLQGYKVVNQSAGVALNYANIEFNPLVFEGQFVVPSPYQGITLMYNRLAPYNKIKGGLILGQPGLYVFTTQCLVNYYEGTFYTEGNNCTSYKLVNKLNQLDFQNQIWNSLGTSSLTLNGAPGYTVVKRGDANHFFVQVLP